MHIAHGSGSQFSAVAFHPSFTMLCTQAFHESVSNHFVPVNPNALPLRAAALHTTSTHAPVRVGVDASRRFTNASHDVHRLHSTAEMRNERCVGIFAALLFCVAAQPCVLVGTNAGLIVKFNGEDASRVIYGAPPVLSPAQMVPPLQHLALRPIYGALTV